jgi:predicted lipoprotein with Yx(FWY)xxD motif
MKRLTTMLAVASVAFAASVAVATASSAHAAGAAAVVGTRSTSLGTILVGPNGHTLYLDKADSKNKATCTGGCASIWPPLTTSGKPKAKGGAKASDLGTIKSGATKQVTYKGHPLYYFASDTAAGQTTGEGQNGFYVVSTSGKAITNTTKTTTSSSGGGW